MGKNRKKKKQQQQRQKQFEKGDEVIKNSSSSSNHQVHQNHHQGAGRVGGGKKKDNVVLPLPFPSHMIRPTNDFLRNEEPYKESFQSALNTAYEGFVVDEKVFMDGRDDQEEDDDEDENDNNEENDVMQNYLEGIYSKNYFRRDVTQPFGLGTKCAKTYVTRCLVGEEGTTYKYLGLRMFAHKWNNTQIEKFSFWKIKLTMMQFYKSSKSDILR